ncbi:MAG: hypothetical protein P0Y56_10985 [Candidatus Andeanibacterium colombiense]|uniref:Uncharacterized protein n=1 Tax=Candidatus Andeanibacterium colombiense TaxID=3121345 RepID=A0AAJ5X4N1_9SPHN|nr:MAG: hypothetical protein P0Y56_10985 [Sphingomonadaceae bacterium]
MARLEPGKRRAHRLFRQPLAGAVGAQDPAGFGHAVEVFAQPAKGTENPAIADRRKLAASAEDKGAVAVEQPAAGVAAEAFEMIWEAAVGAEMARRFGGIGDREQRLQIGRRRAAQVESPRLQNRIGRSAHRLSTKWMMSPTSPPTSVPLTRMN